MAALGAAGLFLALDLVHLRWVIMHAPNWGFWDWDFEQTLLEATRRSIVEYGQVPLWNPYVGGGSTLAGDSLNHTWGLCFLPILLLGTLPGIKVCLLAYLLIAQGGTYALARNHGVGAPGACLAAILYSLGGVYAQHIAHGHFEWIAMAWFPLATLAVEHAAELRPRPLALGGCVVAFCVFDGGPYQFVFLAVFLGVYAVLLSAERRSFRPMLGLATILALGAGLSAVKLAPMLETAQRFPRQITEDRFYGAPFNPTALQALYQGFVSRDQLHRPDAWMPYVLNVGSYVGWIPLLLAMVGTVTSLRRRWPFVAVGLFVLWTALGTSIQASPWAILHGLPGFAMLRVPSRFTAFVLLVVAVLAGAGLEAIERLVAARLGFKRRTALPLVVVALVAADLVRLNGEVFKVAFSIPPLAVRPAGQFKNYLHSPYLAEYRRRELYGAVPNWQSAMYPAVLENRGVLDGYHPTVPFETYAVSEEDPAFRGYVWSPDPAAEIVSFELTPNRIRIETNGQARVLIVNQNHDPGWKVEDEPALAVRPSNGLIAVSLPPGGREVTLVYAPDAFRRGAVVSLATLAVLVLLLFSNRMRYEVSGGGVRAAGRVDRVALSDFSVP